jgi:hypothetical protein
LFDPLFEQVATAELFTVYVPACRDIFKITMSSHQSDWELQFPLAVGPELSAVPAAFSSVYVTVCPERVVSVHSLSEVTVDAVESVNRLVLVGLVHTAVFPLSKRMLLQVPTVEPSVTPLPQPGWP